MARDDADDDDDDRDNAVDATATDGAYFLDSSDAPRGDLPACLSCAAPFQSNARAGRPPLTHTPGWRRQPPYGVGLAAPIHRGRAGVQGARARKRKRKGGPRTLHGLW